MVTDALTSAHDPLALMAHTPFKTHQCMPVHACASRRRKREIRVQRGNETVCPTKLKTPKEAATLASWAVGRKSGDPTPYAVEGVRGGRMSARRRIASCSTSRASRASWTPKHSPSRDWQFCIVVLCGMGRGCCFSFVALQPLRNASIFAAMSYRGCLPLGRSPRCMLSRRAAVWL